MGGKLQGRPPSLEAYIQEVINKKKVFVSLDNIGNGATGKVC